MPALRHRRVVGLAALALSAACTKPQPVTQQPSQSDEPGGPSVVAAPPAGPPVKKTQMQFSVRELGPTLDAATAMFKIWIPDEGIDLRNQLGGALAQEGFAPGTLDLLDLQAAHAGKVAVPHEGQEHARPEDVEIVAFIPAKNSKALIEALPTAFSPQPLGGGLWQGLLDDTVVAMREQADALELALSVETLDQARPLADAAPKDGPRLRFKAWDLPTEGLDRDLPIAAGSPIEPVIRVLADVAEDMGAVEVQADFSQSTGVELGASVEAPFERLGLEPLGAPMTGPSALAQQLPPHPVFAVDIAWGDPTKLHKLLDDVTRAPLAEIPSPFAEHVRGGLDGFHKALDQVEETVFGAYLDSRGRATIVLAATVKDEQGALEAERAVLGSMHALFSEHIKLEGNDPERRYTAKFKKDSLRVGSTKADHLEVTAPRWLKDDGDTAALASVVGPAKKAKLDIFAAVKGKTIVIAMGAGAKTFLSGMGKGFGAPLADSLESGGGLDMARQASGGCQLCMVVEPKQALMMVLTIAKDDDGSKVAKKGIKSIDKLALDGQMALGGRASNQDGRLAIRVPADVLFPSTEVAGKIVKVIEDLGNEGAPPPPAATTKRR